MTFPRVFAPSKPAPRMVTIPADDYHELLERSRRIESRLCAMAEFLGAPLKGRSIGVHKR